MKQAETIKLDPSVKKKTYPQDYRKKQIIKDVQIITLKNIPSEEGDFGEIFRLKKGFLESVSGFEVVQMNRTNLIPGSVKAWHLHFEQDEIWYVCPSDHVLVGLWDVRADSPTNGATMRHVLGAGSSQLIYIPHGVAHGSVVLINRPIELFVLVNRQFDIHKPDEQRISWDALGKDFWSPKRD